MKHVSLHHLLYLDGWRGIAIILVLLDHFFALPTGVLGVDVFFVLSGYLMSRILFIKRTPILTFYRRRIARILPVFWLYVVLVFIGGVVFLHKFNEDSFVSTILFARSYYPERHIFHSYLPIGHVWSLNVEEFSYLFLSFVAMFFATIVKVFRVTVLAAFSCVVLFFLYKYLPLDSATPFYLRPEVAAFPLLLSSSVFLLNHNRPINAHPLFPVLSLIAPIFIVFIRGSYFFDYIVVSFLLAASVNTLHLAPDWFLGFLSSRILTWFGVCSYSIYLWQQIFFFAERYYPDVWYKRPVAALCAIMLGYLSFRFYEKPMRAWLSGRPVSSL